MGFDFNWLALVGAAIIPSIIGFLWYGQIMAKPWLASTGKTEDYFRENSNMPMNMGISLLLSFVLAFALKVIIFTSHGDQFKHLSDEIVGSFNTFGHGAMHGATFGAFFAIPFFVINGLFELRGAKNYFIHIVYWIICCALMGGVVDTWG